MNSTAIAQKVYDIVNEPTTEKERIEVYLQVLSAYLKTATNLNKKYSAEMRSSLEQLQKNKRTKAELS